MFNCPLLSMSDNSTFKHIVYLKLKRKKEEKPYGKGGKKEDSEIE